jgi:hypothetical protein
MAYAARSINDYVLLGSGTTENPNQLDTMFFCDFSQHSAISATTAAEGGVFYVSAANGGAGSNTSAAFSAFSTGGGVTAASGTHRLSTGTTLNSTGYAGIHTSTGIIPGFTAPSNGNTTKYEFEAFIAVTLGPNFDNGGGFFRLGFMSSNTSTTPDDGVYFEHLYDGTTNDTTWNITFRHDGSQERVNTGVTVTEAATYRMYLCVECTPAGVYTTTYSIKNGSGVSAGTASPSAESFYPSSSNDYMGSVIMISKVTDSVAVAKILDLDYFGTRIRRPVNREILLFS